MNQPLAIKHPDPAKMNASFAPILAEASTLKIADQTTASRAGELLRAIKGAERFILEGDPTSGWEGFAGHVEALHKEHKFAVKIRDASVQPYRAAYGTLNDNLLAYEAEVKRKAEEESRAQEAAARKAEEERLLQEAIEAKDQGQDALAEEILETPVTAPTFTPPAPPKIEGRSVRENFKAKVVDMLALVRWVAQHPEDLNLLDPNMPSLNALARSRKRAFKLPGCELVVEQIAATRVG